MRSKQNQIDSSSTSDSSSHHTATKQTINSGFSPTLTLSTSNSSSFPSASLLAECRALQQDELIALQSIYTSKDQFSVINSQYLDLDSQSFHSDLNFIEPKLRLSIPINFPNTRKVRITSFHTSSLKSSSNLGSRSKLDPTQVANADSVASAQSRSSTSNHSYSTSSSTKQVGPNGIDVISQPSRISTHSSTSKGEPKSIDAHLAKEARRSTTNQDQVTKSGNIDVEVNGSGGKMSSRGNGKGKNGRKTNGKRGNSSVTNSQLQAPWEMRAQALADSTSSKTGIANSKVKSHQSKAGVIAGISHSSSSDSTSSSTLTLTSTSNPNRSSEANKAGERKYLNPNARPFSSSLSTSSIASSSTSSQDAIIQNPSNSTQPSNPNLDNEPIPTSQIIEVSNLPPITLYLSLPSTYPLESAPRILSLSSPFLMEESESSSTPSHFFESPSNGVFDSVKIKDWIQNKLLESWEETKSESLWNYGEFLAEGLWKQAGDGNPFFGDGEDLDDRGEGTINFSELVSSDEETTSDSEIANRSSLATRLMEYDKAAQSETFSTLSFTCSICLESRRGSKCFQIKSCSHVFCLECLKDYFTMMIIEGFHLQASRCPDVECVKRLVLEEDEESEKKRKEGLESDETVLLDQIERKDLPMGRVSSQELSELLGPQLHSRYLWLIKKSLLESNPTASNCPRQGCDGISIRRKEDTGTRFENFRTCEICSFNWCTFCKKTWHGFTPCKLKNSMELVDEFLSHPEGSLEREKLYSKFGKKNLDRLVKETVEEKANLQYLDKSTTQCPHCQIRIEKSAGCNHMTCFCCQSHFCYLCQQRLNPREPYRHFNTPNTPCFQKLFEGALPTGMGADGQLLPGFAGIAMEGGGAEEEEDWDERHFPARLIQEMMREM